MAAATRIYAVTVEGKHKKLVRAASQAAAIRHVAKPMFAADVATQDELVELAGKGVKVEDAASED